MKNWIKNIGWGYAFPDTKNYIYIICMNYMLINYGVGVGIKTTGWKQREKLKTELGKYIQIWFVLLIVKIVFIAVNRNLI